MKKTNQRLLYLLPLLLTVTLIIFGEALGDLWKEDVKAVFRQNKWLLLAFVLLLALVGYLWERQQRSEKTAPEAVDKDQYDEAFVQFRKNLLEQYQIRLNSKTGRRLPVNLTAKSTHFGMAPERVEAYFKDKELTIGSDDIASEIDKILNDNARLLLIGDPGAGKTTILLYAAINILNTSYSSDDSESSDELQKLPLILNLATWSEGRDFAEWYAQNIAHTYSLSPVFVQELLRRNAVVPFFDGFDEVAEQHRDDCFQKMAAWFGDEKRKQLIVSSRKKEYAAAKADAPVYTEIEVQPLSLAQTKKALSENAESQAADRALLHALEHDRWLAEAVETPFYLNTASFLFGKGQRTLADFPFETDSIEGRQAELVEIFVAEQVTEERDRKYLHFLAEKMDEENFLVFELVKMQRRWGGGTWGCRLTLIFGIIFSLLFSLFIRGNEYVFFGFFLSLIFAISLFPEKILTIDTQVWKWKKFIQVWENAIFESIFKGFIYSFVYGITFILLMLFIYFMIIDHAVLIDIGASGFIIGFIVGVLMGLKQSGSITNLLLHIPSPYQRFYATFLSYFWITPVTLALFLSSIYIAVKTKIIIWEDFVQNLFTWFALLLVLSLTTTIHPFFISKFPQHVSLRLVLYLEGKMPLRVVTFMDRMTDQLIFEDNRHKDKKGRKRRGATWRFRHKILQDYFAGMEEVSAFEERKR